MKILIAGSDINAILIAQYLKLQNKDFDIYLTTDESDSTGAYTPTNIKDNDISSICDFIKNNNIDFTIATSELAMINGLADELVKDDYEILSPESESARVTFFNSIAKKIMYKLKIPTPRFGIFDKENMALDYIRKIKLPIIVKNDFTVISRTEEKYSVFSKAKSGIQKIFENLNEKIIIESYIDSEPVYLYFITDGYNAVPLINLERKENESYLSITAQSEKINENMIIDILRNVIYPLVDDIAKFSNPYKGILGLKIKTEGGKYNVLEFYNNFQSYDIQAFLSLLNDNLFKILYDTANGCLADNHDYIKLTDEYSYTIVLKKEEKMSEDETDEEDLIISQNETKIAYTLTALTKNRAKEKLIEYVKTICKNERIISELNEELRKVKTH